MRELPFCFPSCSAGVVSMNAFIRPNQHVAAFRVETAVYKTGVVFWGRIRDGWGGVRVWGGE